MCVGGVCAAEYVDVRGQSWGSWFSSFTCVPEIKVRLAGLAASALPKEHSHWP